MLKVLIVEDDSLVADLLEEILEEAGFAVCGVACTVAEAIELGERHNPDLGVIDFHLPGGEYGMQVAAALRQSSRFGVLYATGNPDHPLLSQAEGEGCITKPYSAHTVVAALRVVSERMSNHPTSAFPRGFRLLVSPLIAQAA